MALNPFLFVYGSLLSSEGHEMGRRLAGEAVLAGPATLAGRLHAVSWYPGAVEDPQSSDVVHGEVWRLADPASALMWLDSYEGISGDRGNRSEPSEYARLERSVQLAAGGSVVAWVYLYQLSVAGKRRIPTGRWSDR